MSVLVISETLHPVARENIGRLPYSKAHNSRVPTVTPDEDLAVAGTVALAAGRWADARGAFESALAGKESPEVLDGLGEALWWLGEPQAGIAYRERAYVGFRRAGEPVRAAMTAIAVCVSYWVDFGNEAAGSGWFARAESAFPDGDPGPLRGWFCLMRGYSTAEFDPACELIRRALSVARETGDVDLELTALSDLGGKLVGAGQVTEGLALIDQAMAGTLAGECQRLETVVWASCTMLGACEIAGDLERATQWLLVIDEFTDRYGCPFMYATCRTHYSGLLVAKGRWDHAERELGAAIRMSGRAGPVPHAQAVARLADLRLRQGRIEEADTLLADCHDDLVAAKLRLARGETAVALALLRRCLSQAMGRPAETAAVLVLLVEAQLAAAEPDLAAQTVEHLGALAAVRPADYPAAQAATAAGHLAIARGDLEGATRELHSALMILVRLDLPVDVAQVRLALARAYVPRSPQLAVAEAGAALTVFDRVGATTHADAAAALLRTLGASGRRGGARSGAALTRREQEVLQLVGVGLSNPEIAERLYISRKTAAHHVSNMLSKLGLRNRAEAVAHIARASKGV